MRVHVSTLTHSRPNLFIQTGPQWKPIKGKGEGIISRLGSGLCFDFANSTGDTALYYVGTEDGVVHKCSCSYNEQYLKNYHGHTGPVYKLRCHPLNPNVFISCSADWTIKLWDQTKTDPVHTIQQKDLTDAVRCAIMYGLNQNKSCSIVFVVVVIFVVVVVVALFGILCDIICSPIFSIS